MNIRFFRNFQAASQMMMLGAVLSSILNRVESESEDVGKLDWGTFGHRLLGLGSQKDCSPSVLMRRIRKLFPHSPTLVRIAELLETFPGAPNTAIFNATYWLASLETPEKIEGILQSAQNATFNLILTPGLVDARLENR